MSSQQQHKCKAPGCVRTRTSGKYKLFCETHACRVPTCVHQKSKCPNHHCQSNCGYADKRVFCGRPIEKSGEYCEKHACHDCGPRVDKHQCVVHFCNDKLCGNKKKENSVYCDRHSCPVCNHYYPCADHMCKVDDCKQVGTLFSRHRYCDRHDMHQFFDTHIDKDRFNNHVSILNNTCLCYNINKDGHLFSCVRHKHSYINKEDGAEEIARRANIIQFYHDFIMEMKKKNDRITRYDTQEYNLTCVSYCSEGYCSCDLMPHLRFYDTHQHAVWVLDKDDGCAMDTTIRKNSQEEVYILSDVADARYTKMTWTVPKKALDDMDINGCNIVFAKIEEIHNTTDEDDDTDTDENDYPYYY